MAHEAIENITWKDYPLTDTPITANNLNKMSRSISTLDDGLTEAEKNIEESGRDLLKLREDFDKEIEELKKSVSDGKSLVASAITNKGVTTAADATFQTMASNIAQIFTKSKSMGISFIKEDKGYFSGNTISLSGYSYYLCVANSYYDNFGIRGVTSGGCNFAHVAPAYIGGSERCYVYLAGVVANSPTLPVIINFDSNMTNTAFWYGVTFN